MSIERCTVVANPTTAFSSLEAASLECRVIATQTGGTTRDTRIHTEDGEYVISTMIACRHFRTGENGYGRCVMHELEELGYEWIENPEEAGVVPACLNKES